MQAVKTKIKGKEVFVHVLGSILFLIVPFIMGPNGVEGIKDIQVSPNLRQEIAEFFLLLLFFYINYFYLIPRFYFTKKYFKYILLLSVIFILIAFVPHSILPIIDIDPAELKNFPGPVPPPMHDHPFFNMKLVHDFFIFLAVSFFSIILKISNRLKQTEKEKLNSELLYLRSQINPHFLFNTLNSIYSLAIDKSDYTATAIVKLSGMMRYVVSETNHDFVSLEKEISYIGDYIELQKIRFDKVTTVSFEVTGELYSKKIAPLILIPFIENAFKFGVNPELESKIEISVEIIENELTLTVKNNKVNFQVDQANKSGLGIENAKTRLKLLYPNNHTLVFRENENEFFIRLMLKLQ
jgi:hypothetical protein